MVEQARRLRALARRQRISVAALVRKSVDRVLQDELGKPAARYERAALLVGAFTDREGAKDSGCLRSILTSRKPAFTAQAEGPQLSPDIIAVASISTCAPGSMRPATITTDIAG